MISMTGYAKKDIQLSGGKFSLIIKSLNSTKGLDLSIKTPRYLLDLEPQLRNLISDTLIRGKISVIIMDSSHCVDQILDEKKLRKQINALKSISPESEPGSILNAAISLPSIYSNSSLKLDAKTKLIAINAIKEAVGSVQEYRQKEGDKLSRAIKGYVNKIIRHSNAIIPLANKRDRLKKSSLNSKLKQLTIDYDRTRLESELIYFFEKHDVTEELVRLNFHCDFFLESINSSKSIGKKLNFIAQEMLREINTIGSKAGDFLMQKRVVLMKEEVEKIKEQVQNIL
tara:strand:+ start:87 stop:941 length:855 start_codon:yes stop_codon:yes gene_type:complete